MMPLENQVISLDLAKRLKEFGFKQDSLFYYERGLNKNNLLENYYLRYEKTNGISNNAYISAYTVAELGEMLPIQECIIEEMVEDDEWYIKIEDGRLSDIKTYQEIANTEADARAKMLIYLKNNNLI